MKPLIDYIMEKRLSVYYQEGIDTLVNNFDFEVAGSGNDQYVVKSHHAYKLLMNKIKMSRGCLLVMSEDIDNKFSEFVWLDIDEKERSVAYTAPIKEIVKLIAQYVNDFQKLSGDEMHKKYSADMWHTGKEIYKYDASEVDALKRSNFAFTIDYLSKQPWFVTLTEK